MIQLFHASAALFSFASVLILIDRIGLIVRRSLVVTNREDIEAMRRTRLKSKFWMMQYLEPIALEIGSYHGIQRLLGFSSISQQLPRSGNPMRWTAEEYLGAQTIRAVALSLILGIVVFQIMSPRSAILVSLVTVIYMVWRIAPSLARTASRRIRRFKRRLPFAIDLMAIMLDSGSDIRQGIQSVIDQNRMHPVGEEFEMVQVKFQGGKPLIECLEEMRERLKDEEVTEFVFSVRNAEKLGVPMSKTLLGLSEHMRSKQIQRVEQLIGERKVMMVFPGMVVMLACMLVAVAVFAKDFTENVPGLLGL